MNYQLRHFFPAILLQERLLVNLCPVNQKITGEEVAYIENKGSNGYNEDVDHTSGSKGEVTVIRQVRQCIQMKT